MMTGYVLAGGRSSRMGCDKALLAVGSRRLIELVIEGLRPHVKPLVVIAHTRNRERLRDLQVDGVLTDLMPDGGPLMGVYTGLMSSQTPLNLFVPCDMPWMDGRVIGPMVDAWREGIEMMAHRGPDGCLYPFPLLCHAKALKAVGALLDRGMRSLHSLLEQPQARLLTIDAPDALRYFTNVNTPEDYVQLSDEAVVAHRS